MGGGVLSTVEHSSCTHFVYDTEIYSVDKDVAPAAVCINQDLAHIDMWFKVNEMVAHPGNSNVMLLGSLPALEAAIDTNIDIYLQDQRLNEESSCKYLGVYGKLSWDCHMKYICQGVYPKLRVLNRIPSFFISSLPLIYKQTILPIMN